MIQMMIKRNFLLTCATAAFLLAPGGAQALSTDKNVVSDKYRKIVTSTFGYCVRTKWDAASDACGKSKKKEPKAAAITNRPPVVTSHITEKFKLPKSRSYIVFFDFNRSYLTKSTKEILESAYDDAESRDGVAFEVTGHTDRSGSSAYNQNLSKQRAEIIKKELIRLGVDGKTITTYAKGESAPLIQTKDGIKEPQNRRAEVIYRYNEWYDRKNNR